MIRIQDLARMVAKRHRMPQKDAIKFLNTLVDVLMDGLQEEKVVKIKGLGTFKVTSVKERASVSVNSGEPVLIEGHDKISFIPDASMRDLVNKPFSQFETVVINDGVEFEDIEMSDSTMQEASPEEESSISEEEKTLEGNQEKETEQIVEEAVESVTEEVKETVVEEGNDAEEKMSDACVVASQKLSAFAEQPLHESVIEQVDIDDEVENSVNEQEDAPVNQEIVHHENDLEAEHNDSLIDESADDEEILDIEENEEDMKRFSWTKLLLILLPFVLVAFGLGYFVGKNVSNTPQTERTETVEQVEDSLSAKPVTESDAAAQPVEAEQKAEPSAKADDIQLSDEDLARANQKVAYGAYRIVGIDRVVTARAGQTLKSISVANMGPGAEVYVYAVNEGVTTLSEGQKVRIPKVELKKK